MSEETILFILVIAAGFYMAWNIGANDVANAMGTSVGSHALTLKQAVIIASILEFAGAYFFGSHVTETLQKGIVNPNIFNDSPLILVYGMLTALIASGAWLQLASYNGWPVSTTHSIVGAIVGFGLMAGGYQAIYWGNLVNIVLSWVVSPLFGGIMSFYIFRFLTVKIIYRAEPVLAAKKMIPYIVFFVMTMLGLVLIFNGLKNVEGLLSPFQSVVVCVSVGLIASVISHFLLRRIKAEKCPISKNITYSPEVAIGLEKAKKHLLKVRNAANGEMLFHVDELLDDISTVSNLVQEQKNSNLQRSDYIIVEKIFGYLQIMSACLMAFAHGANDVANAIGPIAASVNVLMTHSIATTAVVPTWTLVLGGAGIVIGLATWGWRVIETIGKKITELTPTRGFAAEFGAAFTILVASGVGMPISTTHTLVGSVVGVGMARGLEALNLNTVKAIIFSWIVTVPAGALLSIFFYSIIRYFSN